MNRIAAIRQHHLVTTILDQHRVAFVFWASAIFGLGLALLRPAWQVAVEPGQVLAGIVQYPPDNPFYIYQIKLWTLLHQVSAVMLYVGLTEPSISILFNGMAGATSFSALALWTLAISDKPIVSVFTPVVIMSARIGEWGIRYPILLIGESHTYGMLGLSSVLLAAGLLAVGQYNWGGLLLALTPAIHPSLGLWCTAIVVIGALWDFRQQWSLFRRSWVYLVIGYAVTSLSFVFNQVAAWRIPVNDPSLTKDYLTAFVRYWDAHRVAIDLFSINVIMIILGVCISLLWLKFMQDDLPGNSMFLLRLYTVSGMLGVAASLIHQLPPESVPSFLLVLMPLRLLNFNALGYLPILLGILWRYHHPLSQIIIASLIAAFILIPFSPVNFIGAAVLAGAVTIITIGYVRSSIRSLLFFCNFFLNYIFLILLIKEILLPQGANIGVIFALTVAGVSAATFTWLLDLRLTRLSTNSVHGTSLNGKSPLATFMGGALILVLGAMALYTLRSSVSIFRSRQNVFRNYANETLYKELSHGKGLIATAPKIYMAQLITRRPILLDVEALDMLPYALEGAAQMHRILMVVYGVDLLSPPPDGLRQGTLPIEPTKTIWLTRTPEQWIEIKNEFGVTDILVQSDWKLQLSGMTGNSKFTAYHIP